MTEVGVDSVAELLDDVRMELTAAVDELERSRASHRRVESLLLAILEHVPVPVVVIDDGIRLRAVSAAAESAWDASLEAPASSVEALHEAGLPEMARTALEAGHVDRSVVPDGFGAALLEEPGTGQRYVVVWGSPTAG